MWFHAKKSKETLKKSKLPILLRKFGFQAQKSPKITKKLCNRDLLILFIGMVFFGCYLVNPHVHTV